MTTASDPPAKAFQYTWSRWRNPLLCGEEIAELSVLVNAQWRRHVSKGGAMKKCVDGQFIAEVVPDNALVFLKSDSVRLEDLEMLLREVNKEKHVRIVLFPVEDDWWTWDEGSGLEIIEKLADSVHQAWMAEKISQGYADHPYHPRIEHVALMPDGTLDPSMGVCCQKSPDLHHPDMFPYAALSEDIKAYDRVTVHAVLKALRDFGEKMP